MIQSPLRNQSANTHIFAGYTYIYIQNIVIKVTKNNEKSKIDE
jgi:hypothetical protein